MIRRALLLTVLASMACHTPSRHVEDEREARDLAAENAANAVQREYKSLALKNRCPAGYPALQGRWMFAGRSRLPEFTDEISITGTRFVETMSGRIEGKQVRANLKGEIRCLFKNRILFMIDSVVPEGAFDNDSGSSYPCDVLNPVAQNDDGTVMLICFFDWDLRPSAGRQFVYRRVESKAPAPEP